MALPLQIDTKVDPDVALTFVIVGGSIAGLATAFALQSAGHHCHILEGSSEARGGRGPTRSPPNMTKILDAWGLGAKLRQRGITKSAIVFRDGDTAEMIGQQKLTAPVMKQFGADFLAFQHSQLHEVLYEAAKLAGVNIRTGIRVTGLDLNAPAAVLDGGERVEGDIVIGAGGFGSIVREQIVDLGQVHGIPDARLAYNFSVTFDAIQHDPELKSLIKTDEWQIWMGNHCCLQGFAQPSNSQYAMLLKAPTHEQAPASETWEDVRPFNLSAINTDGLGPTALKLMSLAKEAMVTQHVAYEPFDHWVHEGSKVLIIGDAAHPLVPSGSQSAAMAIEDAATLGSLFSLYSDRVQIPVLLSAFEDLRQPRCSELQASERAKTDFVSQPHGSEGRKARDAGFKFALEADMLLEDAPEEEVRTSLQDYVGQWTYNALEAVQDWWITYGGMLESRSASEKRRSRGLSLTTEVKLEVETEESIMT